MAIQYTSNDLISKLISNDFSYTNAYKSRGREVDTNVEKIQNEIEEFRKNVRSLRNYSSGATVKSKLEKQISKLVKSYNAMKNDSKNVEDEEIKEQLTKLEKLFTDNEKELKKIGITKSEKEELMFDEEVFEDAEEEDFSKLFSGKGSFVDQANKIINKAKSSAEDAYFHIVERNVSRTTRYDQQDIELAEGYLLADAVISTLAAYNEKVQSGALDEADKENLNYDFNILAAIYSIDQEDKSGELDVIQKLYKDNESNLANLGVSFDDEKTSLLYDENTDATTEQFKDAYQYMFGSDAAFAKGVSESSKNAFYNIINPEKIGVSIIDEQV